ncbi:MAG TPA: SRPBCC family protein [Gemmatimonadales bacterium]|jgi:uncharacterized membrane protein|nr:SRPBCC family protein [Gemmatimonadales bacterium]
MGSATSFFRGLTLGAGLMYFLDPERGTVRRERVSRSLERLLGNGFPNSNADLLDPSLELGHYGARIGDIEGLGGATLTRAPSQSGSGSDPVLKVLGGLVALYGITRRGAFGGLLRTLGAGLMVGTAGSRPGIAGLLPRGDRRRAVDIQKTLHIAAPVEQVYAFWSNYENFPLFMSHVREVQDLGGGRSRWRVSGPGGLPIEWQAVLTQQDPNQAIAWRSEPGSMLENAGMIRFVPVGAGTRVDLRLCYHPPAGGAGQAVAELLGSDPRAKLNQDLGRMKELLEATHRSESHGKESRS